MDRRSCGSCTPSCILPVAFFEHERFACAYSIYIFPRTRSPFFHADAQANVSFAQTQDFITSASKSPTAKSSSPSPSKTGHDGIDNRTAVFIEKSCSITAKLNSTRPINVVFVDEIQIGETRSNGDQQYNVKGHAFEGKTKYEARCTVFHVKADDLWKTEDSSIGTDPIE